MIVVGLVLVVVLPTLFFALHWYAWRRLVHDTTTPGSVMRRAGTVVFVTGPLLLLLALPHDLPGVPFRGEAVVDWPGFMWLALFLYLLPALFVGEVLRPLLHRIPGRRRGAQNELVPAPPSAEGGEPVEATESSGSVTPGLALLSRRVFVSRVVGSAATAVAVATVGYGTYGVLRGPRVKRITVPLAKLPRTAHGFRIAVVSDMHLGPLLGRDFAQRVVDTINSTQPDLIAIVGDLVDGSVKDLSPAVAPLAQLRARHGSFFVTGNHEYLYDAQRWITAVRDLGVHPLENTRVELPGFDLAGVNDVQGARHEQGPDFAHALGDRDRARTAVLLAHQPVVIDEAVEYGVNLQLSGHTHGGQLWPGPYVAKLVMPTVAGLHRYGGTQLYVSRGAGAWGPPVRVGAPSDITVIELASRQT
ncbi:metallophosphoesterase [Couchioplanes caeruleus]|uniref:metallophosphoesterase n=1 Tax=Couchioplanes caeruleus TaxID=56438 RepID=UPI0020C11629|nr:metallophosphoesterase [Couchioplanes caeruleus]UQU66853.1 metallophosphoesterase [Couchioplanes caeruleus]